MSAVLFFLCAYRKGSPEMNCSESVEKVRHCTVSRLHCVRGAVTAKPWLRGCCVKAQNIQHFWRIITYSKQSLRRFAPPFFHTIGALFPAKLPKPGLSISWRAALFRRRVFCFLYFLPFVPFKVRFVPNPVDTGNSIGYYLPEKLREALKTEGK